MTIKTWEDRYNAPEIISGHITDHMQAEITELRARVASDAITMMRLAGMSQDCALKAKGIEDHLEIAQGTLKNLRARVAELEAELATANSGLECYAMQLAKDTVQSDIDCIMAQGVEIAQLKAELAAIRNQQPIGYLEKHLIESGRKIQLCNLTKTRLWSDSVPVYLAAGAQPLCKFPTCHSVDYQDELCKSLEDGRIDVPKGWQIVRIDAAQPVPESKTIATAPECLNTNDKAFWATGWNECRKAMLAAAKEPKCQ